MSTISTYTRLLANRRLLAVLCMGFASGLPLALTGSTLQAWFTQSQIDLVTIGTLSLLGFPYLLKFLWAPLMDQYRLPLLGRRRGWIAWMQVGLVISLLFLANMNPATQAMQMAWIALVVAFFSASQDISVTAYQTDVLSPEERGLGASYYIFAYRIALLLSGGAALVSADYIGWKLTYELMAGLMLLSIVFTCLAPEVKEELPPGDNVLKTGLAALFDLLSREKIMLILFFIAFYKFGDALGLQLLSYFLLHGLGFSLTEVGLAYKTVSFVATILGAFTGGVLLTRWNIYRALFIFGLLQAFSNLTFAGLAFAGKHYGAMVSAVFIENFCTGLSTAALLAFMMSLCHHRYTASQFALLSAIASLSRVLLGPLAAILVQNMSWAEFFVVSFLLSFPGIICLLFLKDRVLNHAQAITS